METARKTRKLMIAGIVGCLLYVVGDFLFAATGKGQTIETIGLFTKIAYLEMAEWRMWARILVTFCNPIMLPGVVGNLVALLPWPINQLDHGIESFGHALVLVLGLILLKEMVKAGEIKVYT